MIKNKQKITYVVFLLFFSLSPFLQAAQPDHTAKRNYQHKELVKLLKIRGIGLQIVKYTYCKGQHAHNILILSGGLHQSDCLDYITKQGKDKKGNTDLILSAQEGHLTCVNYLVQAGADIHAQNKWGNTALISCARKGHLACVKYLVEQGANIHAKNRWRDTALLLSAEKGHIEVVKYLVGQGANIHVQNLLGYTVLHSSECLGHLACLKFLVAQGATINTKNILGETSLVLNARKGHLDCVKFLVAQGADLTLKTKHKTALEWAAEEGHTEIVACIKENLAKQTKERKIVFNDEAAPLVKKSRNKAHKQLYLSAICVGIAIYVTVDYGTNCTIL